MTAVKFKRQWNVQPRTLRVKTQEWSCLIQNGIDYVIMNQNLHRQCKEWRKWFINICNLKRRAAASIASFTTGVGQCLAVSPQTKVNYSGLKKCPNQCKLGPRTDTRLRKSGVWCHFGRWDTGPNSRNIHKCIFNQTLTCCGNTVDRAVIISPNF